MTVRLLKDLEMPCRRISTSICVVGAGIAGLIVANRLSKMGHDVVVLESGYETENAGIEALNEVDCTTGTYAGATEGRVRGLGGTSVVWGGRMLPLTPGDMSARPHAGVEAWPIEKDDLDRYQAEIEHLFAIDGSAFDEGVLPVLDPKSHLIRDDPDFTLRFAKWPTFRRCNLAYLLDAEIRSSSGPEIWLGATACDYRIDRENGRLTGLLARDLAGHKLEVEAREFVLAAGTIEVTRQLLQINEITGGKAFVGCDALGRYFNDHLGLTCGTLAPINVELTNRWFGYHFIGNTRRSLHIELTPEAQIAEGTSSAFAQVLLHPAKGSGLEVVKEFVRSLQKGAPEIDAGKGLRLLRDSPNMLRTAYWRWLRRQLYLPSDIRLEMAVWIEQAPRRQNRISLSDRFDALDQRRACIEWSPTELDERTLRACVARLRSFWSRVGLNEASPVEWDRDLTDPESVLADRAEGLFHPAGTTRMGVDPAESVVDSDLRCHHVGGVSIVSASVFPSSGSANPTYTIIQLAMRAADSISHRLLSS